MPLVCVQRSTFAGIILSARTLNLNDSQAVLKALLSYELKSSVVLKCVEKLNSLAENNAIRKFWVPGHVGPKEMRKPISYPEWLLP